MPWASHKLRSGTTDSKIDARWWIATLVLVSPQQAEMTSLWWFRYIFPNTHAHVQLYVLATLIHGVTTLVCTGRLLAAAFNTRRTLTHTDPLFQLPLLSQLCLCLLKPQCTNNKLSRPRVCGLPHGVHHTTPLLRPLHAQVVRKAHPPSRASGDAGRNDWW